MGNVLHVGINFTASAQQGLLGKRVERKVREDKSNITKRYYLETIKLPLWHFVKAQPEFGISGQ